MMRLIDADALMRMVFNDVVLIDGDVKGAGLILADAVEEAPTVDAEVVVRCKNCKWFADNNDGSWYGFWLFQTIQIIPEDTPKPDDFCSYGEPKMEGGAGNASKEM